MTSDIEQRKQLRMANPVFAKIAEEYKRRYGFIWSDEIPKGVSNERRR